MKNKKLVCFAVLMLVSSLFAEMNLQSPEVSKGPLILGYSFAAGGTLLLGLSAAIWSDRSDPNTYGSVGSSMVRASRVIVAPGCCIASGVLGLVTAFHLHKYYSAKFNENSTVGLVIGIDRVALQCWF
jgi:hypothetical protein